MKGLQKVRGGLGKGDVITGGVQRLVKSTGMPDPIGEGAAAEVAAEEAQKKQMKLLEQQQKDEQLALAEADSEVNKRKFMAAKRTAGRASLIRTSNQGLIK